MQPLTDWSPGFSRSKPFEPPEGGTPNHPRFIERLLSLLRMHRDLEPAWEIQSAAGRRTLQNLAEVPATMAYAPASWSAAVLRRFRWERALEICAVHGKPPFVFSHALGP